MEKKKNDRHFIIPPSYFQAKGITPIPVNRNKQETQTTSKPSNIEKKGVSKAKITTAQQPVSVPKISIDNAKKSTSGLSLKSIRKKKEHQIKQLDVVIDEEDLPTEPVSQEALTDAWNDYASAISKKGEKILASILQMDKPKLKHTAIHLTYSNNTNKIELERAQFPLLAYLRKRLKNYDLHLEITVNEEIAKKYAFTPIEKYEKLKEKNPNIELLKKAFGLDI